MAIKRGSKVESPFGSASMTDMIFLLLIFFMVATTLISPNALKLTLPKSSNIVSDKPYTTVSITNDLKYYVELDPVPFDRLEETLKTKMVGVEDPTISLHSDESVPIGEIVKVMVIANNNKYKLILATTPK
ncbi:MAG: biopolymer transporter ExbD [Rikenellaceae bacterium]|nr:biopolymer transporter ExbD [Rikenellaceae bacterium]